MHRAYTFGERLADGAIHLVGIVGGLLATIYLLGRAFPDLSWSASVSLIIYATAMIAMFAFSAAYNLIDVQAWADRLRRFDQAAIFVKIAGTYTPFAVIKIGGFTGYGLLAGIWSVALVGIAGKLLSARPWKRTTIFLYLALGWVGALVAIFAFDTLSTTSLLLLVAGGLLYSFGLIFHVWSRLPYQNATWHLFVLAATACHFLAIASVVFE